MILTSMTTSSTSSRLTYCSTFQGCNAEAVITNVKPSVLTTIFLHSKYSNSALDCSIGLRQGRSHPFFMGKASSSIAALNDPINEWILTKGEATKVLNISAVGGGCINVANKYDTDAGSFFVKSNRRAGREVFEAEARGLEAMRQTNTIRVPRPFHVGSLSGGGSFIVMEFIKMGSLKGGQAELGRQLAEMHKLGVSEKGFGFHVDNTIGSTAQPNPWTKDWLSFFREHRLGYQFRLARQQYGDEGLYEKGQKLLEKLPGILGDAEFRPSLIHGDLWSGNVAADEEGNPVILDPATYYGHSEAEFGMSWCASFGPAFYEAYFQVMPREPGFDQRASVYRLYHYLNHYNLFGSGYRSSCMSIMDSCV